MVPASSGAASGVGEGGTGWEMMLRRDPGGNGGVGGEMVEGRLAPLVPRGREDSDRTGIGTHGSPFLHAWIQSLIPAPLVVRVGDRTFCRTDPRSTTSSKSI